MDAAEKRKRITRMSKAASKLVRIAEERACKNPKFSIGRDPRTPGSLWVIPYSSVVSIIGFETRKEAEEFMAEHLPLFKALYGFGGNN